ncbi:MAG: AAA domain-containing protein [Desulfobacteraceae bacterium]|nr:AAA domain-containing protein [Desulfobacteraceae bacterium]
MLEDCLGFLKKHMPLNGIIFNIYNPDLKAIECIGAKADIPVSIPEKPIYLSKDGIEFIESDLDDLRKVDDFTTYGPTSIAVARALKLPQSSGFIRHLTIQSEIVGVVIIFAAGKKKLKEEHGRLLSVLNDPFAIALSNILRYRELKGLRDLLNDDNRYLYRELRKISGEEIIGKDSGLKEVMAMAGQVAPLNSKILILGETGVGKEVIANAIHYSSPRRNRPFIKVNCGAISDALIDSELFGHEKGSFTGAVSMKRGRFERAHGGTIFLDEIGEMPLELQKRLLRVLQTGELERVGGMEPIKVDVRVIAATNRNLEELVKKGEFREDLWYRLNVFPITIPPLRQRKNDIPELVRYFINKKVVELNLSMVPEIDPSALNRIKDYPWPGNVRELENAVERELIRCQADKKQMLFFSGYGTAAPVSRPEESIPETITADSHPPSHGLLDDVIRHHITATLEKTGGKIQGNDGAAKLLGLHPSTLRHKLRKLGIAFGRKM